MTQSARCGMLAGLLLMGVAAQAKPAIVSLKESLREKVNCNDLCGESFTGAFTFQFRRPIDPNRAASFDADTEFVVRVHDFLIVRRLGDDPNYAPGDESAEFENFDMGGKKSLSMKIGWKKSELTVTIKGKTPEEESPQAENLRDAPVAGHFAQAIDMLIRINQNSVNVWEVNYEDTEMSAVVKRKTKTLQGLPYNIDKITVKGSLLLEN